MLVMCISGARIAISRGMFIPEDPEAHDSSQRELYVVTDQQVGMQLT